MALPSAVARPGASLTIALLLAGAAPVAARGDAPRAQAEQITTELVLIETYVTDAKGRPIEGLTADDFTLVVDGKPCPIASLDYRQVATGSIAAGNAATPPATGPIRPAEYPRRFMLFFEDRMSGPAGLTAARHAADQFLSQGLLPSDEVALATYDTGLRILHDFTTDREALRRTIAESLAGSRRISTEYAEGRARAEEIDNAMKQYQQEASVAKMKAQADPRSRLMGGGGGGGDRAGADSGSDSGTSPPPARNPVLEEAMQEMDRLLRDIKSLAMTYAAEQSVHLRALLRGVGALVDALAAWPGYKALVFMGDGVPENPATPYLNVITAHHPDPILLMRAQQFSLAPDIDAVRRAAAAKKVTIHTLQTRGLAAGTVSEMEAQYAESNTIAALALATGGLRSSSNDFLRALGEFEASSRAYYVLGYSPSGEPDGRYHAVKVRCRRRGAEVRSREGFVRWTPKEARQRAIQAAHMVPDIFPDLGLDLSAALGPHEGSAQVVDFVAHLPPGAVLFVPEEGGPVARLEVGLVVQDEHGTETFRGARSIRIARPAEGAADRAGIDLYCRLRLPDGAQTATAVVSDDATGTVGAARLAMPAAARGTERALGLSLYSVAEKSLWVEMPFDGTVGGARDSRETTLLGPPVRTTFTEGESAVCGFRRPNRGAEQGTEQGAEPVAEQSADLEVVVRRDGETLRTVKVPPAGRGPAGTVQVTLPVEGLPPGDYMVTVQEPRPGGVFDRGAIPLRIRAAAPRPASGT